MATIKRIVYDLTAQDNVAGPMDTAARALGKVADQMDIADRNARVLDRALLAQGKAADAQAKAMESSQRATKLLSDVQDELSGKAELAAAALRGEGDAAKNAGQQITDLRQKLEELSKTAAKPGITVEGRVQAIDDIRKVELELDKLGAKTARPNIDIGNNSLLSRLGAATSGASLSAPSGLAVAGVLSPALIPVAAGLAGAVGAIGTSLAGAGVAAGTFGLLAKQNFTVASTAAAAVQKAQDTYNTTIKAGVPTAQAQATLQAANARAVLTYNAAIAAGANPAKALAAEHLALAKNQLAYNTATNAGVNNAKAYAAEQKAISAAYAELSPAQIALSKQVGALSDAWQHVQQATTPLVSGALLPWMAAATKALAYIQPIITPVAAVFRGWGQDINRYFASAAGSAELKRMADELGRFGALQLSDIGIFITDIVKGVANLGKDLAAHNVDFGTFGAHLFDWGAAFLDWSKSANARADVTALLNYVHANGPVLGDLLKNLGIVLGKLVPGLAGAGQVELKLITDFLGFIAKLPPSLAKPLLDTAGALLLLSKTGVISVGIKIVGAAAKWLSGGLIDIGGGAAAGAEIRTAMVSGGTAAAAEIRAAMVSGGAVGGAESGAGAAGTAAGKAAGGGFAAGFSAVAKTGLLAGAALIGSGFILRFRQDFAQGWQGFLKDLPGMLSGVGGILNVSASGWATAIDNHFHKPVAAAEKNFWSSLTSGAKIAMGGIGSEIASAWDRITGNTRTAATTQQQTASQQWQITSANATTYWNRVQNVIVTGMHNAQTAVGVSSTNVKNDMNGVGVYANTNAGHVAAYTLALTKIPKSVHTSVSASASGSGSISFKESIPGVSLTSSTGIIGFHAAGGLVGGHGGPTADDQIIAASTGEYVINAASASRLGLARLDALNRYAAGGLVGAPAVPEQWENQKSAQFMRDAASAFMKEAITAAKAAGAKAAAAAATGGISAAGVANSSAYAALQSAAAKAGWTGAQWQALVNVENREAGFSLTATNPSSGAYGLAQFINGPSEYAQYGGNSTTAAGQAVAMVNYIKQRYGTPSAAWAHELAYGWYDRGGVIKPGLTLAYNGTGRPEQVTSGDDMAAAIAELRALRSEVRQLTGVAAAIPAKTGQHVAAGVNSAGAGAAFRRRYPAGGA